MKLLFSIILMGNIVFASSLRLNQIINEKGQKYGVPPVIIKATILTENEEMRWDAINENSDGSFDIGVGQINTIWLDEPATKHFNLTVDKLLNPEINIEVVAFLLSRHIRKKGLNYYAIGCYHNRHPEKQVKWLERFKKHYNTLLSREVVK